MLGGCRDDEAKVTRDPEEDAGVVGEAKPIHRRSAVRRSALVTCTVRGWSAAPGQTDRPGTAQRGDHAEVAPQALQNVRLILKQVASVSVLVDDERRHDVGKEDGSHRAAAVRSGEEEGHGEGSGTELERARHQLMRFQGKSLK